MTTPATTAAAGTAPATVPAPSAAPPSGAPASTGTETRASGAPSESAVPLRGTEDWAREKSDYESRLSRWQKLNLEPEEVERRLNWALERDNEFRNGTWQRAQEPTTVADDPYARWDELTPRQQADLQRQGLTREINAHLQTVEKQHEAKLTQWQQQQAAQLRLYQKASRLVGPDASFEDIVQAAAQLGTATPDALIELAAERVMAPKKLKDEVERQVTARLAEIEAQRSSEEVTRLSGRPMPSFMQRLHDSQTDRAKARNDRLAQARATMAQGLRAVS